MCTNQKCDGIFFLSNQLIYTGLYVSLVHSLSVSFSFEHGIIYYFAHAADFHVQELVCLKHSILYLCIYT